MMFLITALFLGLSAQNEAGYAAGRPRSVVSSFIRKTAAFTDSTRETEEEYAKSHDMTLEELRAKTAASGNIHCGEMGHGGSGAASVVRNNSLIVKSNHIPCEIRVTADKCTFTYHNAEGEHTIPVASVAERGGDCESSVKDPSVDWLVLILASPAIGITPFRIDISLVNRMEVPKKVILLGNQALDFCKKSKSGRRIKRQDVEAFALQRFIDDCEIRYVASPGRGAC